MKTLNPRARRCPICSSPSKKKGFTKQGRQRWYCKECKYSFTATDDRQKHAQEFAEFLTYITTTTPRRLSARDTRAWDRKHAWCWQTRPIWTPTGQVYDQVFIDGTYIAYNWCVLIAYTREGVIAYQLCDRESKAAYLALLRRLPAPIVATTDGAAGALAAIKQEWPTTRIQRCLVHVQRNIRQVTTTRPQTEAHKALYKLALDLTKVDTREGAIAWQNSLHAFHELYDTWLAEKTYREETRQENIPSFARKNKKWWYTHTPTRKIVGSLDRYVKQGVLFTFLDPTLDVSSVLESTTNRLEGGVNAPLKEFLHIHRGWSQPHLLTALDYWLYSRSINTQPMSDFASNKTQVRKKPVSTPSDKPAEIDTHIDMERPWEDGLNIRKGRIGS
ncbi:IS1249 family transposase [Actinotignum sp. GS-2025e]|uniref:IS1249 family transposase n=3 Tax=Actinotignum TaxID=1653174 RepID=UPI0038978986|nr:IS1249 family transposase [Gleimia europaea]